MFSDPHDSSRMRRLNEIIAGYLQAVDRGQTPDRGQLLSQHPDLADSLRAFFADHDRMKQAAVPLPPTEAPTLAPSEVPTNAAPCATVPYFGDYESLQEIARGGMGVVYKARQVSLNRMVALKMILSAQLASPQDVQRFHAEAEAAANLDHPNIVPIYEVGEHEGQHYFSMKLIEGGSLAEALRSEPRSSGSGVPNRSLTVAAPQEAVRLLATVARAVHYAHQRGILHRDLKPANILLDAKGEPHITDFGLAKRVEGGATLTQSGAIVGTPSYMAPEQARAEKGLSTAVDTYSLGAILYELLTGQPPFRAETPLDTILQVLEREPSHPRALNASADRDVATIALKCLEKDPQRRYRSADALADDMDNWLSGKPILARPSSFRERTLKWGRRRPALAALLLVSAASLLVLLVMAAFLWQNAEKRAEMVQSLQTAHQELDDARQERISTLVETEAIQDKARRVRYDADMQFAHAAWKADNVQGLLALLENYRPKGDGPDLRGFEWGYLWGLCHAERLSWQGHTLPAGIPAFGGQAPVLLAISPDGKTLASAGLDKQFKLWDVQSGTQLRTLAVTEGVAAFGFSPDSKSLRLLVPGKANPDSSLELLQLVRDVSAGKAKPSLQRLMDCFTIRTLSLDGQQRAHTEPFDPVLLPATMSLMATMSGGMEMASLLMNAAIPLKGEFVMPMNLALSPDRKTLAIGGMSTSVSVQEVETQQSVLILWDLAAGKDRAIIKGHAGLITAIAFSPDGQTLVTTALDKTMHLRDAATGREKATLGAATTPVASLAFSRDGKTLASGNSDGTVRLWNAKTGQLQATFMGHVNLVTSVVLALDGRTLASASGDGVIKLWDAATTLGPRLTPVERGVLALTFTQDSKAAVLDRGATIHFFDPPTGKKQRSLGLGKSRGGFRSGALAPGGGIAAFIDADNNALLFDSTSGKELHRIKMGDGFNDALAFSPNAQVLAVGRGLRNKSFEVVSGEVVLWDAVTGMQRATLKGHSDRVVSLAFSPDGQTLASGSDDQTVKLWNVAEGKEIATIRGHNKGVLAVAYSRDGSKLATAGGDTLSIREAATGKVLQTFRIFVHHVVSMSFNAEGSRLATAGSEDGDTGRGGGVKLWDLKGGQEVLSLGDSTDVFSHVTFSADGRRLLASRMKGASFVGSFGESSGELVIWSASDPDEGAISAK
jgi:WD40 repeat protein/serine/threonine protein kinase